MKFKYLLLLGLTSTITFAEETAHSSKLLESIIRAEPLKRVAPKYPSQAQRRGHEGWVKVSYVIEPDGSVSNAFVVDSSGLKSFEKSTLKAVRKWQFTPATENGKPIQQCVNNLQMDYTMQSNGKAPGVTGKFRRKYKEILALFDAKDFQKAGQQLEQMGEGKRFTLYEDKLYWQLQGYYHQHLGDEKNALFNFRRSSYKIANMPDEAYLSILDNIFVLELKQNLMADALKTFAKIEKADNNEDSLKRLKPYQQKIQALVDSERVISVPTTIGQRGFARYNLARNHFELSQIQGEVDKIKVFCDNKQNTFSYAADSSWTIPKSWGSCSLYVYGKNETAFNIVEHPKKV